MSDIEQEPEDKGTVIFEVDMVGEITITGGSFYPLMFEKRFYAEQVIYHNPYPEPSE